MARIGIIGGGAWGTALALVARRAGAEATIWARESDVVAAINARHENPAFLPDIQLDPAIRATGDMAQAVKADAVLLVPPAQHMRGTLMQLADALPRGTPAVVCAKGIEHGSCALMSEIVKEILPASPVAVLSGPTFAGEVARSLPTAVTLACADATLAEKIAGYIGSRRFRTYLSDDVVGAELGGAVKNVLAIACGITIGRKLGENARAALITRGLAEIIRLGLAKGARMATLMGLSGLGDLTLTCNSAQSRNTSFGIFLGEGVALDDVIRRGGGVREGVHSAAAVRELSDRLKIEMPICFAVNDILNRGMDIDAAISELLDRPVGEEMADLGAGLDRPKHFG